jgi:uncharacterized protein YkwD
MLGKTIWVAMFVAVSGFYSCQKEDISSKVPASTDSSSGTPSTNVNKATLVQLVNNLRQSGCTCGSTVMPPAPPVVWHDQLATAAFNHSTDMSMNNYFSHSGLNGSTAGDRITAAGYAWRTYGENIAKGYMNEQSVMDGWVSSEGHCKNLMNPAFKEMGVGRAGNYWTQEFGAR